MLSAPVPPPWFDIDIHYDTSKVLNPLGVYVTAIDFMYHFAQEGWDKVLDGGFTIWAEGFDVEIDIEASHPPSGPLRLQTSHIVFGLYRTIVDVAAQSHFCEVLTSLFVHRRQIGMLVIEGRTPRLLEQGEYNASNGIILRASTLGSAVTYPSGDITDPVEPEFSVSYTFSGDRINSRDIFLAVIEALAISAQFSWRTPFRYLDSSSPSGKCVVRIVSIEGPFKVNYSYVTKALRSMIRDVMVILRKFEDVTLQLKWNTFVIAEGSIKSVDHG